MMEARFHPWIHRLAWAALLVSVVLTIGLGGAVTSAKVGMAYPTWPDINGMSLFSFLYGKIAGSYGAGANLEHTHRQAGALIGLLAILLAVSTLRRSVPRSWRRLAFVILIAIVIQGLLGMFRVVDNDQFMAIVHALGAQCCVALLVAMVKLSSRRWAAGPPEYHSPATPRLRLWARSAVVVLFLNLVTAASLRHKEGAFVGHLILALTVAAVLMVVVYLIARNFRDHAPLRSAARWLANLLGVQLGLGLGTWAFLFGPLAGQVQDEELRFVIEGSFATAHLVIGVAVLAIAMSIALEAGHRVLPPPVPAEE